ncbi:hypothetical protein L202_03309 [Cryptococcus amylolentus CBS 6039]|uniref:Cytochrome P450 n=1 Tax=Cryptococcus amylolentus CBS 6039 TaxID=1295533 RepID=A0A1E3HSI7_9TREE|nr:hypothetical protein L202_03309 [Cryptococcus amylolentus CBS 6039]ODN79297.1 hypothetical protein L202_03309 [Cryptococcus amylolentus CBS 6039]
MDTLPTVLRDLPPLYKAPATLLALAFATYLWLFPIANARIPFRNLPDPGPGHWLLGHALANFHPPSPNAAHIDLHKTHGHTIKYRTQLGNFEVSTIDPTAISYIVNNPNIFVKPPAARKWLEWRIGHGVSTAMGDDNKHQRRLMGPSFSAAAMRDMVPVFHDVAYELSDKFRSPVVDREGAPSPPSPSPPKPIDAVPGGGKIDVLKYIGMATFDVMGLTGFGHAFRALSEQPNTLTDCMHSYLAAFFKTGISDFLAAMYSIQLPTKSNRTINEARKMILEFANTVAPLTLASKRIAREKREQIFEQTHGEGIHKKQDVGKDLLSILIKANMASDLKPNERLSDEVVADQIMTFLVAGSETVATSLSFFLDLLGKHPNIQDRLR